MKRFFIYSLLGIIAAFASCDKNNPTPAQPDEPEVPDTPVVVTDPVFTASIADTKTTVDVATGKVAWEAGDEITITDAASVSVVYTTTDTGASATFTKKAGETATLGAGPYTAVYGTAPLTAQTYGATIEDLPMTASSATTALTFSVTCGIASITLTKAATNISSVKVSNGTDAYTLSCTTAESIEGGKVFNLVVPAGSYTSFEFTNDKGGVCLRQKSGESVNIAANTIQPISFSNIPFAYIVHNAAELYDAIDTVEDGDKIMLAEGTYTATKTFAITKNITLEGGYGATPAFGDTPDPVNHKAVLDGDSNKYRVMSVAAPVETGKKVQVSGVVLQNGIGASNGGGLFMTKGHADYSYVDIKDNTAPSGSKNGMGGGFILNGADVVGYFSNCVISNNTTPANLGGNYVYGGAEAHFDKCLFSGNSATNGGGLYIYTNSATRDITFTITNSEFYGNKATSGRAGAIYLRGGVAGKATILNIANCTFHENECSSYGSAIDVYGSATINCTTNIYSCTFVANATKSTNDSHGGTVATETAGQTVNIYNSILAGNTSAGSNNNLYQPVGTINSTANVISATVSDYLASAASTKSGCLTKAYKVKAAATTAGMNVTALKAAYTGGDTDFADALGYDQWGAARTGTTAGACVTAE